MTAIAMMASRNLYEALQRFSRLSQIVCNAVAGGNPGAVSLSQSRRYQCNESSRTSPTTHMLPPWSTSGSLKGSGIKGVNLTPHVVVVFR